jgi:hypothetical protein
MIPDFGILYILKLYKSFYLFDNKKNKKIMREYEKQGMTYSEYKYLHIWISRNWGKADHCDKCSGEGLKYEWSLKHGHAYSRNIRDYIQLCSSCHKIYDGISSNLGDRKWSEEKKIKYGKMFAGEKNPFFGKTHTDEQKLKWSKERKNGKRT